MNQIDIARQGQNSQEMIQIAKEENIPVDLVRNRVAEGEIVILSNRVHRIQRPVGVGKGLRTKVNANIGTSTASADPEEEVRKAQIAVEAGADTIMDLSTGGDLTAIRRRIMEAVPVVIGTVPIYQAAIEAAQKRGGLVRMTPDDLFRVIEQQAEEGVDFFTVHCGITQHTLERLRRQNRLTEIVSRGGSFLVTWMVATGCENPLYEEFDRLLSIVKAYDVTLSLGDGFRPGCLVDATDRPQIEELLTLGELAQYARERGVQVMIEGPGHVPIDQIRTNIQLEKRLCQQAPFYVLGPLVTDVAPGYDHITSAIGGAIAAAEGADFLCYVTPGEHLTLPNSEEVRQGVIAARIAAHAADIVKGIAGALEWDRAMSHARKTLDWERQISLAIDPITARRLRERTPLQTQGPCGMCGEYCALRLVEQALHPESSKGTLSDSDRFVT